jgi:uncharacterized protein
LKEHKKSHLGRVLTAFSGHCFRRPKSSLAICFVLFAVGLFLSITRLELQMDWTYLFEDDDAVVQRVQDARDLFPLSGDIAVLVDQGTPAQREVFLDTLGERLNQEPETFFQVFYKVDLHPLASKALYYVDEKSLEDLASGLRGMLQGQVPGTPTSGATKKIVLKLLTDLDRSLASRGRAEYEPVWEYLAEEQEGETIRYLQRLLNGERYVYPTIGGGQVNVLLFHTAPWGVVKAPKAAAVKRVRQIIEELTPTVKDVRIRLTGLPVMLNDERETCTEDSIRSGVISIVMILIIFAIGFGEFSRPVFAVSALGCGLGWTMGYTTLVVGHLNFITVSLVTMLMGLGIDFGIHLLFRYDEELARGCSPEEAMDITIAGTGVDTFVGAAATAAAFLALTQADFRGISDFGIIASGGVMLCFFSTIAVLPSLLALYPGRPRPPSKPDGFLAWAEGQLLGRARVLSAVGLCFLLVCGAWATQVGFDYNLLKVQAKEIESVRTEIDMVTEFKRSVLSGQVLVKGEDKAREFAKKFEQLPTVSSVGSVVSMLPVVSPKRQRLITEIVALMPNLHLPEKVRLENAADLLALQKKLEQLEKSQPNQGSGDPDINLAIEHVKQSVDTMDPGPIQDGLVIFQENVRTDLGNILDFMNQQVAQPPTLADLPPNLVMRYVSPDGYYKLSISAERNIWEKEHLEQFLDQTTAVDPNIIGHPVVQEHILAAFNRAFNRTPWFTLLGVLTVMIVYLRSLKSVCLALLPTATGVLVIFATMGYVGIDFNVVNFVALPMSVGIGAVYGVHSLHRMRELNDETILTSSTGPALLLSGVTTMVGFASLMTAHHRGLSSLGFVIAVGVAVNFGGSLIFLPAMRRALRMKDTLDSF